MDAASPPSTPRPRTWRHNLMMAVVSCAVGPLVAGTVLWAELLLVDAVQGVAWRPAEWPGIWAGVMLVAYIIGLPYALLTSGLVVLLVAQTDWRGLLFACVIALLPALLFWAATGARGGAGIWASGFLMIVSATAACWYLTRRWHSPNT